MTIVPDYAISRLDGSEDYAKHFDNKLSIQRARARDYRVFQRFAQWRRLFRSVGSSKIPDNAGEIERKFSRRKNPYFLVRDRVF